MNNLSISECTVCHKRSFDQIPGKYKCELCKSAYSLSENNELVLIKKNMLFVFIKTLSHFLWIMSIIFMFFGIFLKNSEFISYFYYLLTFVLLLDIPTEIKNGLRYGVIATKGALKPYIYKEENSKLFWGFIGLKLILFPIIILNYFIFQS